MQYFYQIHKMQKVNLYKAQSSGNSISLEDIGLSLSFWILSSTDLFKRM